MRLSFVGELGWELHIPKASSVAVYRALMAAGARHGLVDAGYRAIDSLSIEKGEHRLKCSGGGGMVDGVHGGEGCMVPHAPSFLPLFSLCAPALSPRDAWN